MGGRYKGPDPSTVDMPQDLVDVVRYISGKGNHLPLTITLAVKEGGLAVPENRFLVYNLGDLYKIVFANGGQLFGLSVSGIRYPNVDGTLLNGALGLKVEKPPTGLDPKPIVKLKGTTLDVIADTAQKLPLSLASGVNPYCELLSSHMWPNKSADEFMPSGPVVGWVHK